MKAIPLQPPAPGPALQWMLQAENDEDFEFMEAVTQGGHHASIEALWGEPDPINGAKVEIAKIDFSPKSQRALKAQAGRQALGAIRELAGLISREFQAQGHVVAAATDPDAHEQVAARLVEIHMMLQSLGDRIGQLEVVIQEINRHKK